MLPIEKFLDILAQRDLLSEKQLAGLRQQVAKASKPISPEALAKRLIEAGHLTPALAKRLLAALPEAEAPAGPSTPTGAPAASRATRKPDEDELGLAPLDGDDSTLAPLDDDELGLAPLDDDDRPKRSSTPKAPQQPARQAAKQPAQPTARQPVGPSGKPAAKQSAKSSPAAAQKQPKPSAAAKAEATKPSTSLLDEELSPLDSAGGGLGPLDGLLAGDGMDAAAAAGSPLMPLPTKRRGLFGWLKGGRRKAAPGRRENVWESPVLLFSGGALLGLLILGAVLLWALGRQSGDEVLAAANEEYRAGSYTQAIHQFDQYLRRFPRHQGASGARVKRGLANMRQTAVEGGDWPAALATAQQVLKEIQPEDAFGEAGAELAGILPAIAEGLAARAQQANDPELLGQAREALELAGNRNIVPTRLQPTAKLDEVEAQLGLVERQIGQGKALAAAVAAMEKALAENDAPAAYEIRHELLRSYPALAEAAKLMAATRAISAVQQSAVQVTEEAVGAIAELPPSLLSATLTLAERTTKEPVPNVEGEVLVTVAAGAAYGFDATEGRLLWKRYLGEAPDGLRAPVAPVAAGTAAGSDVFVLAPTRMELWRLDARTGRPRWRLPLGEPVDVAPVLAGRQLLVATRPGRLHVVDAESGASLRQIQLPQPIPVAPAVDTRRGLVYQAADHSNLFVLELASGACLDVVHLGHAQGSLAAAPVLAPGVLLVPVNDRARSAVLRVYATEPAEAAAASPDGAQDDGAQDDDAPRHRLLQEFRVRGQFDTSPVLAGRTVVAITDLGAAYAFELSAAEPESPLVRILQRETAETEPLVRYGLFQGAQFYLADNRLTKFDVRAAEGRLVPQWVSDERSAFLEPPRARGNAIFHVRRRVGEAGVMVAAVHADDGRTLWQNRIAVPLADRPVVAAEGQQVIVASRRGTLFQVDADAIRGEAVLDQPAVETDQFRQPVSTVVDLGDGAVLLSMGSGSDQLALFEPDGPEGRYAWRLLPGQLTCPPSVFQGGVLLPCLPGHLLLLDPRTNEMLAKPFQPPLAPNSRLPWRLPAASASGHVAATDGLGTLYSLAIEPEPAPHLKSLATVELARPSAAPLAATGEMVFAVDEATGVIAYELPGLESRGQWSLDSAPAWGPVRVGEYVLLATEAGELLCFDAAAKLCWRVALPDTSVAGAAVLDDGHLLLATAGGTLWRIDPADGRERARVELDRPLGTGPVPMGREVLVGGRSGGVYRVEVPVGAEADQSGRQQHRAPAGPRGSLSAARTRHFPLDPRLQVPQ